MEGGGVFSNANDIYLFLEYSFMQICVLIGLKSCFY